MVNYYLLTKPGIIFGNLVTFAAGFLLASKGSIDFFLFFLTAMGLAFIIASACVFNNYIDRHVDKQMKRTKHRALALGMIQEKHALYFALLLWALGCSILLLFTNRLTLAVANFGFFVYVCLYSLVKCQTTYSTLIGSIAGALPPVIGYVAVKNAVDIAAVILFCMMICWQMPHFFSIALWNFDDYANAKIPLLPIIKGTLRTKIHITLYILCLIPTAILLTYFGYTGTTFAWITTFLGLAWLIFSLLGFSVDSDKRWSGHMFRLSLIVINGICFLILLESLKGRAF